MDNNNEPQNNADESLNTSTSLRGSWPFGLDTIQQALQVYDEPIRNVLISAFRWCVSHDHPLHMDDFAARVKSNSNTLWKIYMAKYRFDKEIILRAGGKETGRKPHPQAGQIRPLPDGLIKSIEDFIAIEKKRFAMGETALVVTPTLKSITTCCDLVRESQTIGFVVGPSHIGKSWALELDYTVNNNHGRTIYVRLPAAANLRGVLTTICEAMNISPKGNTDELTVKIKNGLTKDMLLILDEVHLLAHTSKPKQFFSIMEVIRGIHDAKKVGLILCFTILDNVTAAKSKELQQLWRRAIHKLNLPVMPTIGDLTAILEHNGLKFPEADLVVKVSNVTEFPRELLRQLAKSDGLLAITERIRYARNLAKRAGKPISWSAFIEAHLRIAKQAQQQGEWI